MLSAETKGLLMVHEQQVDVAVTLVAVAHRPASFGMFLLADEVEDRAHDLALLSKGVSPR